MQNKSSVSGLKNSIQLLEIEQAIKGQLLKEQFFLTYESIKPGNLLRKSFNDLTSSPYLLDNILGIGIGLATGYLSKKIFIGASANMLRKFFGSVMQIGVTKVVTKHPEALKSFGQFIFQHLLRKKELSSDKL